MNPRFISPYHEQYFGRTDRVIRRCKCKLLFSFGILVKVRHTSSVSDRIPTIRAYITIQLLYINSFGLFPHGFLIWS